MIDFSQLDLDTVLNAFPKIGFVGGIVGHRLDIHAGCVKSNTVRISLSTEGILALEQVIIYGKESPSDELENLTNISCKTTSQSSTRFNPACSEDAFELYGAHKATNGIVDGYNRTETELEESPYWEIIFPKEYYLETIHISNFSAPGYAEKYSGLNIEYLKDGKFLPLYQRRSIGVLQFKLNQILDSLKQLAKLKPSTPLQRQCIDLALSSFKETLHNPGISDSSKFSEHLLDCVEAFLPVSLEPKNKKYQLRDLTFVSAIKLSGITNENISPRICINYIDPSDTNDLTIKNLQSTDNLIRFAKPQHIINLNVSFEAEDCFFTANNFRLEISQETVPCKTEDTWFIAYDNSEIAELCQKIAWVAFLAGNESARCIGLISKPSVMMRRNEVELNEAYMWSRLNLHGKPQAFKDEVVKIVNSATAWDEKPNRLSFGRHSFSTCLSDRNQAKYIDSISKAIAFLSKAHFDAMLLYGTLLGAVRDGTFIAHDDDVDIGYVSHSNTHEELIYERQSLINQFKAADFNVSDFSTHLTFSVSHKSFIYPYWVEIFPIWSDPDVESIHKMYMTTMTIQAVPKNIIGSANERSFVYLNGTQFPAPADSTGFLSLRYGSNWNIPDPFFEI